MLLFFLCSTERYHYNIDPFFLCKYSIEFDCLDLKSSLCSFAFFRHTYVLFFSLNFYLVAGFPKSYQLARISISQFKPFLNLVYLNREYRYTVSAIQQHIVTIRYCSNMIFFLNYNTNMCQQETSTRASSRLSINRPTDGNVRFTCASFRRNILIGKF